jgi:hypothetical protein
MGQRVLACSVLFFLGSVKGTSCRDWFLPLRWTQQSLFFGLAFPVLPYVIYCRGQRKKIGEDVIQQICIIYSTTNSKIKRIWKVTILSHTWFFLDIEINFKNPELEFLNFLKGLGSQVGIGLLYRPARLHRLAELIPWNWFLGSF